VADIRGADDARDRTDKTIFLGLRQAETTLDPAERPMKTLCAFSSSRRPRPAPGGLVLRRFRAGARPYESNRLFHRAAGGPRLLCTLPAAIGQAGRAARELHP